MNVTMIILRIIHIFSGVFWVGVTLINARFLQPTAAATGPEGQKFMQYLFSKSGLLIAIYTSATLVVLSGLAMYGILSGFRAAFLTTGYGLSLALGGLCGIVAWFMVIFVVRNVFNQMAALGAQIRSQGGPPTPEQAASLQALSGQLGRLAPIGAILLLLALLGMSIAQYV